MRKEISKLMPFSLSLSLFGVWYKRQQQDQSLIRTEALWIQEYTFVISVSPVSPKKQTCGMQVNEDVIKWTGNTWDKVLPSTPHP